MIRMKWPFRKSTPTQTTAPPSARNYMMGATGGTIGRLTADWFSGDLAADEAFFNRAKVSRNRARTLERDDPHIRRFLQMVASNVFGHMGIKLRPETKRPDGTADEMDNTSIRDGWSRWCRVGNCTLDGRQHFAEFEAMALRRVLVDGEVFIRKLRGADNPFGFALQMLDADLVDENNRRPRTDGKNAIEMGIEVDKNQRPLAYHVAGGAAIPAGEIIHLYIQERPHQTRGFTWLAPVGVRQKMLDGFELAAVTMARLASSKGGFFTSEEGTSYEGSNILESGAPSLDVAIGSLDVLPPGVSFQAFDPDSPPNNFAEFTKSIKRGIASGLGVSYPVLANYLEGVSYSSIRAGELADRDFWRLLQWFMIRHHSEQIYDDWLLMALTQKQLIGPAGSALPLSALAKFEKRSWRPRGWAWVDPLKDVQAAREAFLLRVKSLSDIAADSGGEFSEIAQQIQNDLDLGNKLNISMVGGEQTPPEFEENDE